MSLVSVSTTEEAEFFTAWPLYRSGDDVYVQNQLIFVDELDHDFDPDAPWESIGPRTILIRRKPYFRMAAYPDRHRGFIAETAS